MERIRAASMASPIAVFRCKNIGHVNTVFANTVETTRLIRKGDKNLVGVFYGGSDQKEVKRIIRDALAV